MSREDKKSAIKLMDKLQSVQISLFEALRAAREFFSRENILNVKAWCDHPLQDHPFKASVSSQSICLQEIGKSAIFSVDNDFAILDHSEQAA